MLARISANQTTLDDSIRAILCQAQTIAIRVHRGGEWASMP